MARHKTIGRRKARTGTRKQSGGFLHLLNPLNWFKKDPSQATVDTDAAGTPPLPVNKVDEPNVTNVTNVTNDNNGTVKEKQGWFSGGGSRKKSRKTRHRRRRHHRK